MEKTKKEQMALAGISDRVEKVRQLASYLDDLSDELERAQQEVERIMDEKSFFVSMAAHELKAPLAVIKEGINVVLQQKVGVLTNKQKRFLGMAKQSVERLGRMSLSLLNYQKLVEGKSKSKRKKKSDLNKTIGKVIDNMRKVANKEGLGLEKKLDNRLPDVKIDRDQIIQVLVNLVNNAIAHTKKGCVYITTEKRGKKVVVAVKDSGKGIRRKDLPKIFKPFAGGPTKAAGGRKGTGLGLAICKMIVKGHGGEIWVESERGKGSTFFFSLPL